MAAATKKKDGWGLGVPCKNRDYRIVSKERQKTEYRIIPFLRVPEHLKDLCYAL